MRTLTLLVAVFLLAACSDVSEDTLGPEDSQSILPSVSITSPQTGAIFDRGIYPVNVNASHKSGIRYVTLKIGMKDIRYDYEPPYSFIWLVGEDAVPTVSEGSYDICATAMSNTEELNSHCIKVQVDYK